MITENEQKRISGRRHVLRVALCCLIISISPALSAETYPLDPLNAQEIVAAVGILRSAGHIDRSSRFAAVRTATPAKQAVLAWEPGEHVARRAFIAVRHNRRLYEAIVDLDREAVLEWQEIENAQPGQLGDEWMLSQRVVRADPAWRKAVKARGIDDPKSLVCVPSLPGYFGPAEDPSRRLGRVICYDGSGDGNLWGRPLEGLVATIDFDEQRVIDLYDAGAIPPGSGGPPAGADGGLPMPSLAPAGPGFDIDGHWVEWGMWKFHLHVDPRTGPVLSRVTIDDGTRQRSVVYRAELAEMFVPYMDPTQPWYFRAFLDVGEYGIGSSGTPLRAGKDCPAGATLLNATFADSFGKPQTRRNLICVFERVTGDAAWSHFEVARRQSTSRRRAELVVRFMVWLGNYDYVLDWIFGPTGTLTARVGATGVVQVKGVAAESMASPTAAADTRFGRLILPHTVAVNHDHFFSFRIDTDVDGPQNSLSIDRLQRVDLDPGTTGTPRQSIWQIVPRIAQTERDAMLSIDPRRPALWRIISTTTRNASGYPTSFELRPGDYALPLVDPAALPQPRAAFTQHHLWVTPYQADERYPAGDYPNQHPGGAGLPAWTRADRTIANQDIVLWYTMGMHHVVRAEDWPLMPTVHSEFELRPFDFLRQNPDVPIAD